MGLVEGSAGAGPAEVGRIVVVGVRMVGLLPRRRCVLGCGGFVVEGPVVPLVGYEKLCVGRDVVEGDEVDGGVLVAFELTIRGVGWVWSGGCYTGCGADGVCGIVAKLSHAISLLGVPESIDREVLRCD